MRAVGNLGIEADRVRRHLRYLIFLVEEEPLLREPLVDALYTLNRNVWEADETYSVRSMRLGGFPGAQRHSA